MIEEKYLTLLKELGTDNNPHSGDLLINHLSGTHDLLQAWGDPRSVCLGGLFHSIYGTQSYKLQSASLDERDAIREVIGAEAEELAFLFSVTQRRDFFTEFGKPTPQLFNRLTETYIPVAPQTINQLLEMEMANYAEFLPRERLTQDELEDFAAKVDRVRSVISKGAYQTISELLEAKKTEAGSNKGGLMQEQDLTGLARRYIEFFNNPNGTTEELSQFLSPEIVWQEMPNRYAPNGRTTRYDQMLLNFQTGQKFIRPQRYQIDSLLVQGDTVALQLSWEGTAVHDLGPVKAGTHLTSQVASFLRFQDGKLVSQIDYPCYPPFSE